MPKPIRQIRIEGNVAYVSLTKGYEAVIDADDVSLVEMWMWSARKSRKTVYAVCRQGGREFSMHRILIGAVVGEEVDHRDLDGLNNRRRNLRKATTEQNQRNVGLRADNKSGVKGVSWNAKDKIWKASIKVGGKQKYLGSFKEKAKAADAYATASAKLHGEFGRTA